ncbi:MAG: efflux transporter outer membrane subunit, partial [Xanthomonadales bacterium]|nr:efflux transporter outer membrane subunit [Xanthomonadales bacterium]
LVALPAGLPSESLLRRPDIQAAEHQLRAANANIGAARAAFFPSISLTGNAGTASSDFSGLFGAGTRYWQFVPQINLPIFQGGALRASLGVAQADQDIALANYERAIQTGFREVADAISLSQSLAQQRGAAERLREASERAESLSQARYNAGYDSYLNLLDAQRSLYAAQQGVVSARLNEQANRIALYAALGGGWQTDPETSP